MVVSGIYPVFVVEPAVIILSILGGHLTMGEDLVEMYRDCTGKS